MPANSDRTALPDYIDPPVVETVLGVQFDRLARAKNAHWGAFWRALDVKEWPSVADAPLLPQQFEQFGATAGWARGRLSITQDPACRLQIKNSDGNRMIQVQNTRLHVNWLGNQGGGYPRYEAVRNDLSEVLHRFIRFADEEELGDFRPNQWEVTYVNEIPKESVWETPTDWGFFLPLNGVPTINNIIEGESFTGEWHFAIPGERGRLHIDWQHSKRDQNENTDDISESVRLTLTARGPITVSNAGVQEILDGLDLGHATIVDSFRSLMSENANQSWGLKP